MKKNIHEIFSYPFERGKEEPEFQLSYLKDISIIGRIRSGLFKYFPYKLLYRHLGKDIEYVFLGTKYLDLAKSLSSYKSIIMPSSLREINLVEKEKNLYVFPLNYIAYGVSKIYNTDQALEKESSQRIINFTIDFFKKTDPKFLIVSNDSLFIERFLIYCAREAGIKTICIQHGIFQSTSNPIIFDGKYADYMYVWSKQQKDILHRAGVPVEKLSVLGYPYEIVTSKNDVSIYDNFKICILGQPWERYDVKLGEKKKQIFNKLVSQLAGVDIMYKPHPGEIDVDFFPDNIGIFTGNLSDAVQEYDCFLSLTSTALMEVSLCKKIAIQIYDADFNCDRFEDIGWSYTYDLESSISFGDYIDKISEPFTIDEDAMFVPKNIRERFLALEKSIQDSKV